MPTYEYECTQCGQNFEYFQSMKDEPLKDCLDEQCGGKGTMKRLISAGGGLIFKGSGFYATDYKGSQPKPSRCKPERGDGAGDKSEKKSEASTAAPAGGCACTGAPKCPEQP